MSRDFPTTTYVLQNANLPAGEVMVVTVPTWQALPPVLADAGWSVISSSPDSGVALGFAFVTPDQLADYARLTDLVGAVHKPAGIGDGQIVAWSATLGDLTAVNPTGNSELAYAANVSNSPIGANASGGLGAAVDITGVVITVGNSNGRPVTLKWGGTVQQTALGDGDVYLGCVETTSGSTTLKSEIRRLPNSTTAATQNLTVEGSIRIGAVASTRTFKVNLQLWAPTSNTPAARVVNAGNNPTFIRADAG